MKYFPGLILALAGLLRIFNLTLLPVFVDEAIYIRWSQVMAAVPSLRFLPLSDGKQPLFMWVLMLLIRFFSDPLFIGRLISVICGLVTLVGIYFLSLQLFKSKKVALLSALMWAISPFAVFFDRLALVDSMLTMFGIWTIYFAVIAHVKESWKFAAISGVMLGFAGLTKSPALFIALLIPMTVLLTKKIHLNKLALYTLISWIIGFGMYNIMRIDPNFHQLSSRNYDYVYPYSHILNSPLNPLLGHLGGVWNYFVLLAPLGLLILLVLGVLGNFTKFRREVTFLAVCSLVPLFLIIEYSKVVTARYILFLLPFLFILASSVLLLTRQKLKFLIIAVIVFFTIHSVLVDITLITNVEAAPLPQGERNGYLEEWTAGQGIKEISEYLKLQHSKNPDIKIVTGTEGYFGTLPDGLQMYLEGVPNTITIGVGIGLTELPNSLRESRASGNKTYLVINKSRLAGDPSEMGLKLIASYPKALRKVGSREYNQLGPREELYFFEVVK